MAGRGEADGARQGRRDNPKNRKEMKVATKKDTEQTIYVPEITTETLVVHVLGMTPLICNRMSEKARHELLLPKGRKNAAEKASSLKHHPLSEYRASPYLMPDGADTLIGVMSSAFKGAMCMAALDLPGTKKAQIGRLTYVEGDYTGVYGVPKLLMAVVRSADMNRTPDIRTRAILPEWACQLRVTFVRPIMTAQSVVNLLTAAGITVGVGDWRAEKGKGNYGQYRLVNEDNADYVRVMAAGRKAQAQALDEPEPYDDESARLLSWWADEAKQRGKI